MDVRTYLKNNRLILDGAMGTMLQSRGLKLGENPEKLNITAPEIVKEVHRAYFENGSNMVLTNTFGANAHKLKKYGCNVKEIISAAVAIAKEAAEESHGFVALDIGPIGELLAPMGTLSFEEAYTLFQEQIEIGVACGVDAIMIETMTDLHEMKCAVLAAKEHSTLPVFATMSFEENMHTFIGTSISAMALTLEGLGVDALGINCSLGPKEMVRMVSELTRWTNKPIIVKPNAGMPEVVNGATVFSVTPEIFAEEMTHILSLGVEIVGGCCGTNEQFIQHLAQQVQKTPVVQRTPVSICAVCSATTTVVLDRVRVIGERINPTGKKQFQQALMENNMDYIVEQAIEQVEAGADILDVNMGMPKMDEVALMVEAIENIQSIVKVPLQIDSSNVAAIEAGLRAYVGKPIVNSVNGEEAVLDAVLPLIKKYGACVVGLTLDKKGIPRTAAERYDIAQKILTKALSYGIPKQDVFIDCLTLTAGAEQAIALETLEAVEMVKNNLGLKTMLGVSNISFGLPSRERMNQVFLTLALGKGLDMPIINPNNKEMMDTIFCFHQLQNIDKGSAQYVARFQDRKKENVTKPSNSNDIAYYIENGLKEEMKPLVYQLLKEKEPLAIANEILIPILDTVGKKYERNELFLPQLLQSAEAAKVAFDILKQHLTISGEEQKEVIVLATVQGDIHDIGKNIVKVVLENYGYTVIDLGKDVPIETIVDVVAKRNVQLVGLSALMTTTVSSMEQTIQALKQQHKDIKIMVGGAVMTEAFAEKIGADYYGKDAMASVAIAKECFSSLY